MNEAAIGAAQRIGEGIPLAKDAMPVLKNEGAKQLEREKAIGDVNEFIGGVLDGLRVVTEDRLWGGSTGTVSNLSADIDLSGSTSDAIRARFVTPFTVHFLPDPFEKRARGTFLVEETKPGPGRRIGTVHFDGAIPNGDQTHSIEKFKFEGNYSSEDLVDRIGFFAGAQLANKFGQ